MLDATKKNTTIEGKVYGLPHIWGTDGLVVNTKAATGIADYTDLCTPGRRGQGELSREAAVAHRVCLRDGHGSVRARTAMQRPTRR